MSTSNAFSLTGKVALITGGGRGIGEGIAHCFVDAGASVALVARTAEQGEAVAKELEASGGRAIAMSADVTELSVLPEIVARAVGTLGGLDVIVNCAGGGDLWRPFLDTRVEDLENAFRFHVSVPFELARLTTPHLLERPGSSIINIVSAAIDLQARGHIAYDASKGALLYATRSMAADLGPRIRVNGIMPGAIETEAMRSVIAKHEGVLEQLVAHTRMRRIGTPSDIGLAAVYLASPAAAWITGKLLYVDGGVVGEINQRFPDL